MGSKLGTSTQRITLMYYYVCRKKKHNARDYYNWKGLHPQSKAANVVTEEDDSESDTHEIEVIITILR